MILMNVLIAPRTGLTIASPVLISSGTFGYGIEYAERSSLVGLGAIISKGTTLEPRIGNQPMRLWETEAGMLNAIGLQNVGVEAVARTKAPVWAGWSVPVLVNVSGTTVDEYCAVIRRLRSVPGISGFELNISCPNVKEGGLSFGRDPRQAAEVTAAARAETELPLIVKLSPNVADIRAIASAVERAGADAISLINTVHGMSINISARAPALASVSGGLSGPAIKPLALYLVYEVAQEVTIPIVGYGGIVSAVDAIEFLLAGASAVGLASALLVNPHAWRSIKQGIQDWCDGQGIRNVREVVGSANAGFRGR